MRSDDLAHLLRSWRDRTTPASVGLPPGTGRRAPGLRREELAALAGVSVDYLTRLEQGRAHHPSAAVLAALARALRLTDDQRDHLYRVAGQPVPHPGRMSSLLTPGIQRLLDRLTDIPVSVYDASRTQLAWNPLWAALMGDPSVREGRDRNLIWTIFTRTDQRVVRDDDSQRLFEASLVADLRLASGRYPHDPSLQQPITALLAASPRFAAHWDNTDAREHHATRKTIDHPQVGRLTLDCDVLTVQGSDLRVIAYTAPADSPDAQALDLVRVLGLQTTM